MALSRIGTSCGTSPPEPEKTCYGANVGTVATQLLIHAIGPGTVHRPLRLPERSARRTAPAKLAPELISIVSAALIYPFFPRFALGRRVLETGSHWLASLHRRSRVRITSRAASSSFPRGRRSLGAEAAFARVLEASDAVTPTRAAGGSPVPASSGLHFA
ncbi:hypothetical protein FKP32DRAFT_1223579 [Trametes sanguinea]|nr:hypothetical protein FKP32DRAFT_1223579 [Trametes sanguinea]